MSLSLFVSRPCWIAVSLSWLSRAQRTRRMFRTDLQTHHYRRLTHLRRWQIHPGSNHFCCNGHCVTGRSLFGAFLVSLSISLTSLLWFIFELPFLPEQFNRSMIAFLAVLLLFYTFSEIESMFNLLGGFLIVRSVFLPFDLHWSGHYPASVRARTFVASPPNRTESIEYYHSGEELSDRM